MSYSDGAVVTIGGIISGLQRKMTKQGNAWAIATVEDLAGSIECMFFPATYQLVSTQLVEDAVVFVKGRLDKREDIPRLVAMEMMVPDLSEAGTNAPVTITIPTVKVTPPMVEKAGRGAQPPQGQQEVRIKLQGREDDRAPAGPAPGQPTRRCSGLAARRDGAAGAGPVERGHQRARDPHHPGHPGHPAAGQPPRRGAQPPQGRQRGPDQAPGAAKTTVLRLDRHRVKPDPALFGDLKVLLGPSCLAG